MNTDRELLELAAKAAGVSINPMEMNNVEFVGDYRFVGFMTSTEGWPRGWFNPLTDDGDALRLAVSLKLEIEFNRYSFRVYAGPYDTAPWAEDVDDSQDKFAATRRAIVCAAAEIGRKMS